MDGYFCRQGNVNRMPPVLHRRHLSIPPSAPLGTSRPELAFCVLLPSPRFLFAGLRSASPIAPPNPMHFSSPPRHLFSLLSRSPAPTEHAPSSDGVAFAKKRQQSVELVFPSSASLLGTSAARGRSSRKASTHGRHICYGYFHSSQWERRRTRNSCRRAALSQKILLVGLLFRTLRF